MPREIITVQLGQCGNQSKRNTVIYAEFEEIMKERERERERGREGGIEGEDGRRERLNLILCLTSYIIVF